MFSIFLAFAIGISTSNFGSLVRYKIPAMPFYVASLFIINHYNKLRDKRLYKTEFFIKSELIETESLEKEKPLLV